MYCITFLSITVSSKLCWTKKTSHLVTKDDTCLFFLRKLVCELSSTRQEGLLDWGQDGTGDWGMLSTRFVLENGQVHCHSSLPTSQMHRLSHFDQENGAAAVNQEKIVLKNSLFPRAVKAVNSVQSNTHNRCLKKTPHTYTHIRTHPLFSCFDSML